MQRYGFVMSTLDDREPYPEPVKDDDGEYYLASDVEVCITDLRALLFELGEHFRVLDENNVHVWPNHPLNPRKRIAEALAKSVL